MLGASTPAELHRLWQKFAGERDAEGLANLYEERALVIAPDGRELRGRDEILEFYRGFMASGANLSDLEQAPPIINGELAITSMRRGDGGVTCEVARRQPDGGWLWIIDKPLFSVGNG